MATKTAAAREYRRKKILDRGADRLAFIAGRTPTLPSESNGMPHPDSSQQLDSQLHHQDPPPDLSAQIAGEPLSLIYSCCQFVFSIIAPL